MTDIMDLMQAGNADEAIKVAFQEHKAVISCDWWNLNLILSLSYFAISMLAKRQR